MALQLQLRSSKSLIYQNPQNVIRFFSTASLPESTNSDEETPRHSSLPSIFKGAVESNRTAPEPPPPPPPPKPPSAFSLFLDSPKDFDKKVESFFGNNNNRKFNNFDSHSPTGSRGHYPKIPVREVEENNDFRTSLSKLHTIKDNLFSKKKNRFRDNNKNRLSRDESSDPFESLGEVVKAKRDADASRKEFGVEGAKGEDIGELSGLFDITSGDKPSLNMPTESSSNIDKKGKGKLVRWTTTTDNVLLDTLIDQATEGKKQGDACEDKVWNLVTDAISQKTHKEVSRKQIDYRLGIMRSEYRAFLGLKQKSGFRWCPIKQNVAASDEQWNEFLAVDRANKKYKSFRDRRPKWDFLKLGIIFGDHHAIKGSAEGGSGCMEQPRKINEDAVCYSHRKDDSDKDKSEGTSDETKVSMIGRLKDMIREMTNTFIDQHSKPMGPLSIGVQLHEELVKMDGFSADYLDCAFELLMRDAIGTRIFLIRNATYRKKMLESMRKKIGDI